MFYKLSYNETGSVTVINFSEQDKINAAISLNGRIENNFEIFLLSEYKINVQVYTLDSRGYLDKQYNPNITMYGIA